MSNLLDKASIILTPTAYNNGEALCVKPSDGSGDFDFSRNSAATRVNAQGLVENVQILSSNLVQNGDFSEEGVQEVSNGSFSQEGSELVTNGDFATDSDWTLETGWSISSGKASYDGIANVQNIRQDIAFQSGKTYKITFNISDVDESGGKQAFFALWTISNGSETIFNYTKFNNGTYTFYYTSSNGSIIYFNALNSSNGGSFSIDNVSVKEVGQDWSLGTGITISENQANFTGNANSFLTQSGVVTLNKTYKATFTISNYVSGAIDINLGGSTRQGNISANGTYTFYIPVPSGNILYFQEDFSNGFIGSITNISVKEVGQNWALGTGWSIGEDKAICDGSGFGALSSSYSNFNSKKLKVNFDILNYVSGEIRVPPSYRQDGLDIRYSANGSYELIYNSINSAFALNTVNFNGSVTNISVIEITDDTNLPRINYEGFSYQDALGSEQIVNGTFDTNVNGWVTNNANATFVWQPDKTGLLTSTSFGYAKVSPPLNLNAAVYKVSFDILSFEGTLSNVHIGLGNAGNVISTTGSYTYFYTSTGGSTEFQIRPNSGGTGSIKIDNVSVKEYLGQEVVPNSGCGSWLFESQSTNLITQSELFSDASWVKINSSVVSGFASPSGNTNAYKLIASVSNTDHRTRTAPIATAAVGTTVTFSIYIKPQEITKIALVDNWTNLSYGVVNLTTNSVIEEAQGTTSVTEILNGFRRVSFTYQTANINTLPAVYLLDDAYTSGNPTSYTFASDGTSGVYIWGAQLEQQSYATSYIPTEGSTVTRNQDVCTNGGSLASINSTEGVLYAEIAALSNDGTTRLISLSDGTDTNRIHLFYYSASNGIAVNYRVNGSTVVSFTSTLTDINDFLKIAFKWQSGNFNCYVNGLSIGTNSNTTMLPLNTLNKLSFTRGDGISPFYGKTKALAVWKEALSDAELTELTTI